MKFESKYKISNQENAFENVISEMAAILFRRRWVNMINTLIGAFLKIFCIIWLCTSNSFENGDFWQTCPHSRLQNGYFYIVRFLAAGIILKHNSWATTDRHSIDWIFGNICIYKSKFLVIRFSSRTIRRTKSPPQSYLALRKYCSTKSY